MRLSCITKGCLMLIFDPKAGQTVQVDLTAQHRPLLAALGSPSFRKVPEESKEISASLVRSGLQSKYKTTRHSWIRSHDEYNKNKPALRIHTNCLHHTRARPWDDSTPEP
jgi:hypothetical protein